MAIKKIEIEVTSKHYVEVDTTDDQCGFYENHEEMAVECAKRNFNLNTLFPALTTGAVKSVKQEYRSSKIIK
ncbi:hypothetical protein CXF68_09195 [Tenacibaculum sp. Bg11-29]|uniref:hypothetical protein n=1 Tax=Tenacibaculum sp. Bg11-29 TaxID=2058306 RepID=UPI000C3305FA|nr:hypothetical protein [Tenacibaculum sp. Bg11-29]PKH50850.1 hypothetical protein CXF68_09195 [Tenacibaculum sp. Bg11-29]